MIDCIIYCRLIVDVDLTPAEILQHQLGAESVERDEVAAVHSDKCYCPCFSCWALIDGKVGATAVKPVPAIGLT